MLTPAATAWCRVTAVAFAPADRTAGTPEPAALPADTTQNSGAAAATEQREQRRQQQSSGGDSAGAEGGPAGASGPAPAERRPQRLVSGSSDRTLRLWDVAARRTLKISRRLPSDVMCLAVTRCAFPPL